MELTGEGLGKFRGGRVVTGRTLGFPASLGNRMKRPQAFSSEEQKTIAASVRAGVRAACPRCTSPLDEWAVPPRDDVSYVRDRVWLVCGKCSRSVVLDRLEP